ncbi:ethylene-insensitive protein 2 [Citrus sinensis]|uniref:Ethylene-insensitive protein 2 n=2 Tax=Citrus sinensis TaxID=2711 RepID=A0ACB8JQY8_CITSI|nr:ethylene-insensitive protein 2 [Citrus sinensis]
MQSTNMDAELANSNYQSGVLYRLVPAVLPVLLISIGYVDPGKWAVIIEGGAHFGFDLVALMLVFNFAAIFCQYLSARIAVVTGKDLAQICGEEYDKWTCVFIGVQTELSVILLDLTMVLGIAHGLNLLMGVELSTCVFLAAADAILFPFFAGQLENYKAKLLWICTAGIILLSYVLGVLISQPEIPLSVNGMLTKFSGDSAFSIMSLLGASMMPHNFYLHSSIVRRHQGQVNISKGALCHDHFFAILCIFSGIYMVNYVLMNSAANLFYSTGLVLLTFQDAMSLMEQVFRSPVVPFAFVLVLFFSNQIIAVNWNLSGQVVLQDFLRLDIPGWLHHATIRIISIVPALYCVWTSGAEGVYQLLIFTQVMVAIMLPSSVIPLFRVASSRQIMGVHKISQYHEFLVLITFMGMLGLKLIFMVEMIFGNSDWVGNLRWNSGGTVALPFAVFLITTFTSLCLMLWLATTPLRSASSRNNAPDWSWEFQRAETFTEREEDNSKEARYLVEEPLEKRESVASAGKSAESQPDASVTNFDLDLPETIMESDQEIRLAAIEENHPNIAFPSPTICFQEESASAVGSMSASTTGAKDVTGDDLLDGKSLKIKSADPTVKTVPAEGDLRTEKDDDEADSWEPETELETEESSKDAPESTSALMSDGPASLRSLSGKSDDGGSSVGSLSRLVGLGRAARRQLAGVLDEFWGQLYDYHGQITQEARAKKLDLVLGVDSKPASLKIDTSAKEFSGCIPTVGRVPDSLLNSSLYDSPKHRVQNSMDSSYGVQRGSSSLWSNQMQLLDAYAQNANHSVHDSGERRYSSLRIPSEASGERRYSSLRIPSEDSGERRYSSLRFPLEDSGERRYSSLHIPSEDSSERRYSSLHISSEDSSERRYSGLGIPSEDSGERRYSSLRTAPSSDSWNYQPATVHGCDLAHLSRMARDRNSDFLNGQRESPAPKSPSLGPTNYMDSVAFALGQKLQNGRSTVQASGFQQNLAVSRNAQLQSERSYFDVSSSGPADSVSIPSSSAKKYHSLPDISGLSVPLREQFMSNKGARVDGSIAYKPSIGRPSYEPSLYSNPGSRAGTTLAFDELSPSKIYRDTFPMQLSSGLDTGSLWSRQPFEQFGVVDKSKSSAISQEATSIADAEAKLLQSFRVCVVKILQLEGSEWLFRHNDGADEDLIDRVAAREKFLYEAETREKNQVVHMGESHYLTYERKLGSTLKNDEASFTNFMVSSVPHCGDGCIWKVDLILSFGVWCIHRILNLSLMESRPELWGKYTYVLNRLQGVIDLAFSRPRSPMSACFCLQIPAVHQKSSPPLSNGMLPPAVKPAKGKCTTAAMLLDLIKDVENAISCRKGRTGTAAGDVAFPKGKENLASVLKRYRRRLSNKPAGTHEVSGPRKVLTASAYGS